MQFLVSPSNLLVILISLALVSILFSFRRVAVFFLSSALIIIGVLGYLNAGLYILSPLENRFPVVDLETAQAPHGIIVLGGGVGATLPALRGTRIETNEAGERLAMAAVLAHRFPEARLIASGGDAAILFPAEEREGAYIKRGLVDLGVEEERIVIETNSRNTYENAIETLKLVGDEKDEVWWLITSAYHMPRSIGCFRRVGLDPIAFPVDFRTAPTVDIWIERVVSQALFRSDRGVHEWVGLVSYWLLGRTSELFPTP